MSSILSHRFGGYRSHKTQSVRVRTRSIGAETKISILSKCLIGSKWCAQTPPDGGVVLHHCLRIEAEDRQVAQTTPGGEEKRAKNGPEKTRPANGRRCLRTLFDDVRRCEKGATVRLITAGSIFPSFFFFSFIFEVAPRGQISIQFDEIGIRTW